MQTHLGRKQFLNSRIFIYLSLCLLLLYTATADAGSDLINLKLSGPVPAYVDVANFKFSPDGQTVVFKADIETDNIYELYSVPVDGSAPPTLLSSGLLSSDSYITTYKISPDNSRVVYLADQDTVDVRELYSVPLSGGLITKLNLPLNPGVVGVKDDYAFSPDSASVVYQVDWESATDYELFSVPTVGGTSTRLNSDLPLHGTVNLFEISPDGNRVVYIAGQDDFLVRELYSVPLAGGENFKINETLPAGGDVHIFKISPDGSRVVYLADQDTNDVYELYSVSFTNPAAEAVKLNPPLVEDGDVHSDRFQISPDSSRVIYMADQETDDVYELYSVPLVGGTAVKISEPSAIGLDQYCINLQTYCFQLSADNGYVVYLSEHETPDAAQLYSVPLNGGPVTKLNMPLGLDGEVESFQISPDGRQVVYHADQFSNDDRELFTVAITGGPVSKLNSALPQEGDVFVYSISADSRRVVYVADQQINDVYEIFSVPLLDGPITKLNGPLPPEGDTSTLFGISSNSNHVVYMADQEIVDVVELFVTFTELPEEQYPEKIFLPVITD